MSEDSMPARLCRARAKGVAEADAEVLAEVLWLAKFLPQAVEGLSSPEGETPPTAGPAAKDDRGELPRDGDSKSQAERPGNATPGAGADFAVYPVAQPQTTSRTVAASFLDVPAGDPLPERHQIERALKPFKRRFASLHDKVLDADATAEQSAERRAITPVYRAARERWFDVALITDTSDGMHVWKDSLNELQRLLARHGAFRQVRLWRYSLQDGNLSLASNSGFSVPPRSILDPSGRRLFIFLTNGTSRDWRDSALVDFVELLGRRCPTVIFQMMPRRAWPHTELGDALAKVTSATPGAATRRLRVRNRFTGATEATSAALTVPMLAMEPKAIAQWSQFLMTPQWSAHLAVKLQRRPEAKAGEGARQPDPAQGEQPPTNIPTPQQRVSAFRAIASAEAYQLMRLMAGVPLSLPIIRLLHASMDGERQQSQLAEVLLSGLVERGRPAADSADADTVPYEFKEGVRDALLETLSLDENRAIDETLKSMRNQARDYVALHAGHTPYAFRAMVLDAGGEQRVVQAAESFLNVSAEIFRKMYPGRDISVFDPGPEFYSEELIVRRLQESGALGPHEKPTGTLRIFSTHTQRTWLIATAVALLIVLDDASTRASGSLLQHSDAWFDVVPVVAQQTASESWVAFGPAKDASWYYSPELFATPEALQAQVMELAPGGARGQLSQVGAMARRYEEIRESMPSGDERTAAMSRVVEQMRRALAPMPPDLRMAVQSRNPGTQLAAVVSLHEHFQVEHVDWLVQLIEKGPAFLAFQAGRTLLEAVSGLDAATKKRLRQNLLATMESLRSRGLGDHGVHATAVAIVNEIETLRPRHVARRSSKHASSGESEVRGWILVAGTGKPADDLSADVQTACQVLGQELSRNGFGLITGGWQGVDEMVAEHFARELALSDHTVADRFIQYMKPKRARVSPHGQVVVVAQSKEYSEPLAKCDALVLIGGYGGTLQIAKMAAEIGLPVLPLSKTGGDAAKFHAMLSSTSTANAGGLDQNELDALALPWSDAAIAAVEILNRLLGSSPAGNHAA